MLFPMFFAPFDHVVVLAVVGLAWCARHYHWHLPRNATVRRLERLVAHDKAGR